MRTKFSRRLASLALVAALSVASALGARGRRGPFSMDAPDYRRKGPPGAKVLIVEFSDFECPSCRAAEKTLRGLLALYDGKVRFAFKHYPLRRHEWARPAALAAECAGRQGRFWEYHDRLYDRQEEWANERLDSFLAGYARELKLDLDTWQACRQDPSASAAVAADMKDGENAWVSGTPTFFINGRRLVGPRPFAELAVSYLDTELKK